MKTTRRWISTSLVVSFTESRLDVELEELDPVEILAIVGRRENWLRTEARLSSEIAFESRRRLGA